jgi:hypothetical protein
MVLANDYPFLDILWSMLVFFGFVIWLALLFRIFGDLFGRHDISGWSKAFWTFGVIILPFVGVLLYLGTQGPGMAERAAKAQVQAKQEMDTYIRETAGSSPADELAKLTELKEKGAISPEEFEQAKAKLLA